MRDQTHPPTALSLMRRWVVDYFNSHDPAACADFIAPDYSLHIGDTVFRGRDTEWLPAVDAQMALFPGLTMTVHQTLSGPDWAAAYFSEHGASGGKAAVWSGVAIYRAGQGRLLSCVAQEDYMTRQRQLKSGQADAVEPPAIAPWGSAPGERDAAAEAVVADWLTTDWPQEHPEIRVDDEHIILTPLQFETETVEIEALHSSDGHVVFHAVQHGLYQGGLAKVEGSGQRAHLHCNGILRVEDGTIRGGRIIRDRLALQALVRKGDS